MFASRPSVHPVEAPPLTDAAENPAGVRMKDFQGMPGTPEASPFASPNSSSLLPRSASWPPPPISAPSPPSAVVLQSLWSLSLALVDIYALLVKRSLRNPRAVSLFTIGDG
ncbi:CASP-like protein 5A1, partial [Ananas comosus]